MSDAAIEPYTRVWWAILARENGTTIDGMKARYGDYLGALGDSAPTTEGFEEYLTKAAPRPTPFTDIGNDKWTPEEQALMNAREAPPINTINWDPRGYAARLQQTQAEIDAMPIDPLTKPPEVVKVKPDSPPGRSLQQALRLLQQQPVGTASNILIEAALQWALVQRENALLRMEVEDLKLRLAAAGVQLP